MAPRAPTSVRERRSRAGRGEEPFDFPPALLLAAKKEATRRYVDPRVGDVPVNFLTTGDVTGGSSA